MPVYHPYPGVYVEEIPSGVRTITGVSTSVTAFVGATRQGPINKPVHCFSYSDYERRFGGLDPGSEVSYAVRQFFANGGGEAIIVRVAKGSKAATRSLMTKNNATILDIEAIDEGNRGNLIQVRVDYDTANPDSTFNVTVGRHDEATPSEDLLETYANVSMNKRHPRYVVDLVKNASELVKITRVEANVPATGEAASTTGVLAFPLALEPDHNQFRVAVDGEPTKDVIIQGLPRTYNTIDVLKDDIVAALTVAALQTRLTVGTITAANGGPKLVLKSAATDESASVAVFPGGQKDVSRTLRLGLEGHGTEADAAAAFRPAETPNQSSLVGGVVSDADVQTFPASYKIRLALDRRQPIVFELDKTTDVPNPPTAADVAARIQKAVRNYNQLDPAFKGFACVLQPDHTLKLTSGTRGSKSFVAVTAAPDADLGAKLKLVGIAAELQADAALEGGEEHEYKEEEAYPILIGSPADRKGVYALEGVDIFNLMCLPGVSNDGILSDAMNYCRDRRAFLIVDAPSTKDKPEEMLSFVVGADLPKTDRAAIYYPWINIPDPLNNGKPRLSPPSGTMAGLYARTDSARGVWKAPAGTDAPLANVQGVGYTLTDGENGMLNPHGVNCIRVFPVYGTVAWGARTLDGDDQKASEWKYIPVRRTALYIEESLYRGLKWVVFEPNDEPLWGQIRLNVGAFMQNLFRQGAFQGTTPKEAYFVKCDRETTTQNDINLGVVNIVVGFAPLKPAEFVIIKLQQMAGQIQT